MTQQEYNKAKRECLLDFCTEHDYYIMPDVEEIFGYAFDRAYTLGKQGQDADSFEIGDKVRVKETNQIGTIIEPYSNDVGYRVYFDDGDGGEDAEFTADQLELYKKTIESKDAEDPVIQGWAARDEDGALCIYEYKPKRVYDTWAHENVWIGEILLRNVHTKPFLNLTWEDEPQEVEIIIKRKKK